MKWKRGRQSTTVYWKKQMWKFRVFKIGFDGYILKYDPSTILHPHKDPVINGVHYRLNIGFGRSTFVCEKTIFFLKLGKLSLILFRPDLYTHCLFVKERTYKVSLGFAKYD